MGDVIYLNKVNTLFRKPFKYFIYEDRRITFLCHVESIYNSILYFNAVGLDEDRKLVRINESISVIERNKYFVTWVGEDLAEVKKKHIALKKIYENVFFNSHLLPQ